MRIGKKTKKIEKIPAFLQSALWSYNLEKMNPRDKTDKRIIVEQVLNYGTWKQLEWVVNFYTWREIKEVVKNPSRGLWMKDSINYWMKFFDLKFSKAKLNKALFSPGPKFFTK